MYLPRVSNLSLRNREASIRDGPSQKTEIRRITGIFNNGQRSSAKALKQIEQKESKLVGWWERGRRRTTVRQEM